MKRTSEAALENSVTKRPNFVQIFGRNLIGKLVCCVLVCSDASFVYLSRFKFDMRMKAAITRGLCVAAIATILIAFNGRARINLRHLN